MRFGSHASRPRSSRYRRRRRPRDEEDVGLPGVADCYSASCGHTKTRGNFIKAIFAALKETYAYLTPDLWKPTQFVRTPFQEFSDILQQTKPKASDAY